MLVKCDHVRSFVVIGASEEPGEKLDHSGVQFWDVANIFEVEGVDSFITECVLIEIGNDFLKFVVSSDSLKERSHYVGKIKPKFKCIILFFYFIRAELELIALEPFNRCKLIETVFLDVIIFDGKYSLIILVCYR